MSKEKPEIIVFYLDLATKILGKKDMVKSIQSFLEEKVKKNAQTSFSVFFFKEGNEPYLSDESTNIKELSKTINDDWKNRDTTESNFENGLFYCLSFLASKAAVSSGSFRVICISDLPSKKGAEYAEALMGLVETVRTFPTFIDIIRVGNEEMYPDDVKLRIVSTLTSGGLFYVNDAKEFKITFVGLAKNKTLPDLREEGGQEIDADKKTYYENLAKKLVQIPPAKSKCVLCSKVLCDYCNVKTDLTKCFQCGTVYHECCAGLYSWKFNIGLKHIFRCIECGAIIKLDEGTVFELNGEILPGEEELSQEILEETVKEEETWNPEEEIPSEEETEEPEAKIEEDTEIKEKKKTAPRMGLFGPAPVPRSKVEESEPMTQEDQVSEKPETPQETSGTSSDKADSTVIRRKLAERRRKGNGPREVRICRVCSNRLKPGDRKCSNCGSPAY